MYKLFNEDYLIGVSKIPNESIDLVISDPPYGLGKDYGNDSDKKYNKELVEWTLNWVDMTIPKMKKSATMYVFTTWQNSPEIFSQIKKRLLMINEIIWDRCVPSMGGSVRKFSSVHDTIGFFAVQKNYYFDLDSIRIPYDPETKKARSRKLFEGSKWLELGYNPKDVWKKARLHRLHSERENHPTQKPLEIIERMIKASCPVGGVVLDPFMGSGTTIEAAFKNNRQSIGYEINENYFDIVKQRMAKYNLELFNSVL